MACEQCGTVVTYGKRKKIKHRLCIDCWKDQETKPKKQTAKEENDKK
ncbi:MAG: hypothetical protein ACXAEF_12390 [Candidatus Thorarchaeota archaeon]